MTRSMLSRTSGAIMLAIALFCCSSCSKNAEAGSEPSAQSATVAQSDAGLIAAQALFEAGQFEEALARLDASDPNHVELRGQVERELARMRAIEAFDSWSVGPGKIKRSPKQTRRLCKRRGGSWIVVDDELRICNEDGKLAVIRVRDGKNVHLTGMYTADYISLRNQTLYENELRLLRESFGEPHRQNDDPTGAWQWQVPGDRTIRLSRTTDGDVFLAVGLASGFSDDPGAFADAVHGALAEHYQRSEAQRARKQATSETPADDPDSQLARVVVREWGPVVASSMDYRLPWPMMMWGESNCYWVNNRKMVCELENVASFGFEAPSPQAAINRAVMVFSKRYCDGVRDARYAVRAKFYDMGVGCALEFRK
jgi:hypothetical protein